MNATGLKLPQSADAKKADNRNSASAGMPEPNLVATYYADPPLFTRKSVNETYCRFFDVNFGHAVGRSHLKSVPNPNHEIFRKRFMDCIQRGEARIDAQSMVNTDETLVNIMWVTVPVKDSSGVISELVAIGTPFYGERCGTRSPLSKDILSCACVLIRSLPPAALSPGIGGEG